ncbi:hepatocyte growth factor-regulated tyrosine kinase substrate-like isoform X2 [Tubulanus polymorphus]|uniref:hepatocyte growth factor-regulated tyrosine kinase substrate-like isoform X2 n=1 Tax=Tubulanus polymorphus TaxID=672921 RepID=UPI003DA55257
MNMVFSRSSTGFDKALDKATSQLLLEPDWDSILQICDSLNQDDVTPKYAVQAVKRKINSENPHIALYSLQVLESIVKNCGQPIHNEIGTKEFMEFMKDLVKVRSDPVKGKVLELVQVWSHAFRNDTAYRAVQDTFHVMKMEGYQFPTLKESDAMFSAEKAPEWKDGEVCHHCRVQFTTFQRKHHCRNCGQVFCGKCTSKSSIIPKFGIEREVRVCDTCFDVLNKGAAGGAPGAGPGSKKGSEDDLPIEYLQSSLAQQPQVPAQKSEQELQEEEELQLALALSKSEAETKEKERERLRQNYSLYSASPEKNRSVSPASGQSSVNTTNMTPAFDTSDMDPELARYLNRNYWENKRVEVKNDTTAAAVIGAVSAATAPSAPTQNLEPKNRTQEQYQNGESDDQEEPFLNALRSSIEIFVNRMKSNSMRGRSIANDSSVQTLFMTINTMHPQLLKYMQEQEDARAHYEALQDKLAQLKDAREALDSLRDDYREKQRREEEERERIRQIQMRQKLEVMRQKKQEYLEYQRQLALQRMRENELELQTRLEQQKQLTQIRQMQQYQYPGAQGYGMPGFSPGASAECSPIHRYQQPGPGMPYGQQQPPQPGQQVIYPPNYQAPPAAMTTATTTTYQVPAPGGYQQMQATGQFQQGQQMAPPSGQPPQGYMNQVDYQSFNMQSMANALPQQQQPQQQQQQQPGPVSQHGQYMVAPPGQVQYGQQQQQPPQPTDAELISFD